METLFIVVITLLLYIVSLFISVKISMKCDNLVITLLLYIVSLFISVKISMKCDNLDPHHDENIGWILVPGFNIIIQLVFLLVIILHREKDIKKER